MSDEIKLDISGIKKLLKVIKKHKKVSVDVGVFDSPRTHERDIMQFDKNSGKPAPIVEGSDTNNATVGRNLEYGITSRGDKTAERSWLEAPLRELQITPNMVDTIFTDLDGTLDKLGEAGVKTCKEAFAQEGPGWQPNKPLTVMVKGNLPIGTDTAQLKNSITYRK